MSDFWATSKVDEEDDNSAWNQVRRWFRKDPKRLPTYAEGEPEESGGRERAPGLDEEAAEFLEEWRDRSAGETDRAAPGANVAQARGTQTRVQQGQAEYSRPESTASEAGNYAAAPSEQVEQMLERMGYLPDEFPLAVQENLGLGSSGSFRTIGPAQAEAMNERLDEMNVPKEMRPVEGEPWGSIHPVAAEMLLL